MEIFILPLVMVEDPRAVVLFPREIEDFPIKILVLSLLIVVLPRLRAVLPSVMLVLPIAEPKEASLSSQPKQSDLEDVQGTVFSTPPWEARFPCCYRMTFRWFIAFISKPHELRQCLAGCDHPASVPAVGSVQITRGAFGIISARLAVNSTTSIENIEIITCKGTFP
ncbi:hypothetical protein DNTS_031546 [Danionella cerebrum]|uniref:Uncharacterized protein n=1 Tax=Danionella cerebrum TaxID=2873325 RepID=A0A553R2V4_9TELE|nr:hypothetical protein DNTS_031546 [Danionella translucida]